MQSNVRESIAAAIVLISVIVAFGALMYTATKLTHQAYDGWVPDVGDIVKFKLDGRRAMVLSTMPNGFEPSVRLRYSANEMTTSTHLVSSDGPIRTSAYTTGTFRIWEIEPIGDEDQ